LKEEMDNELVLPIGPTTMLSYFAKEKDESDEEEDELSSSSQSEDMKAPKLQKKRARSLKLSSVQEEESGTRRNEGTPS